MIATRSSAHLIACAAGARLTVDCAPLHSLSFASVAQLVEQLTLNQRVKGSSPFRGTGERPWRYRRGRFCFHCERRSELRTPSAPKVRRGQWVVSGASVGCEWVSVCLLGQCASSVARAGRSTGRYWSLTSDLTGGPARFGMKARPSALSPACVAPNVEGSALRVSALNLARSVRRPAAWRTARLAKR